MPFGGCILQPVDVMATQRDSAYVPRHGCRPNFLKQEKAVLEKDLGDIPASLNLHISA